MQFLSDAFNKTELDSHVLKFNWSFDRIEATNVCAIQRSLLSDPVHVSSEYSMSKMCPLKMKMIYQEIFSQSMYDNEFSDGFKIGLRRIDSESCAADGFCSVKVCSSNKEGSKTDCFEFHSLQNGEECFSQIMKIDQINDSYGQSYPRSRNSSSKDKIYVTGFIFTQNCCKTRKIENELIPKNISQLQKDFKSLFEAKRITDVVLNVRNEILPAHKFVLSARSPVFQRMFSQDMVEKNQSNVRIDDIDKPILEVFLSFLYTGVLEDSEFNTVFELYSVADKYEVATLFETCRDILTSHISYRTVTPVLKLADMHSDQELKDTAVKYICDNFSKVETTAEWEELLETHPRLASKTLRSVSTNLPK